MKNLKESLNRGTEKVDRFWRLDSIFKYIFSNPSFDIAGVDFVTKHDDIYKVTSVLSTGETDTKTTTKLEFPFEFISLVVLHIDRDKYGASPTFMLVKKPEGPIELYEAERRGRFNKFIIEGRCLKELRVRKSKLQEVV